MEGAVSVITRALLKPRLDFRSCACVRACVCVNFVYLNMLEHVDSLSRFLFFYSPALIRTDIHKYPEMLFVSLFSYQIDSWRGKYALF